MSLDFERPIIELRKKISEIQKFMIENDLDLSSEIDILQERLNKIEDEIYDNITSLFKSQEFVIDLQHRTISLYCLRTFWSFMVIDYMETIKQ